MRRIAVSCLITLLCGISAAGQDFQQYFQRHPALELSNAATLSFLDAGPLARAEVSFQKSNGGLIPLEGSPDAWKADAATEAFRRASARIVFHGKLAYSHRRGKNMGGPILMDPESSPIGFLEEDLSSRGTKKRETYSLACGLAYSLSDKVSLGAAFDYTSADQVKFKDPRFQNVLMDLSLRPGALFRLGKTFSMGVNLEYRLMQEVIGAGLFGSIDRDFQMLVDQGNFYGARERLEGDSGYISKTNDRPLAQSFYGLSLQAVSHGESQYCGELTALYHTGYFGRRSSTSVVFCEFRGPEINYSGTFVHPQGKNLHRMHIEASFSLQDNYTNTYEHEPELGMTGKVVYRGQKKTFSRTRIGASGSYTFLGDTSGYLPEWELGADASVLCKLQNTSMYPFGRDWTSVSIDLDLRAGRNLTRGRNIYSCQVSASFLTGFGDPRKDTMVPGATTTLLSFDNYSDRQFEYETATRLGAGIELKYTRMVTGKLIPYVKLADRFVHLLAAPKYLEGAGRNVACISLGCQF